jgi:gamma-glutamyltranspeptidase/glutathione hydrolase
MSKSKGAVAAGHVKTAEAGRYILKQGGNAYDAAVASFFAACVAEHSLASLGGGGFLLAHTNDNKNVLYDFFAQTPKKKRDMEEVDFYPMEADFGGAKQEFHIGMGAMATPGGAKGIFKIHEDLCTFPMEELVKPAVEFAREGIEVNGFSAFALELLEVIFKAQEESFRVFKSPNNENELLKNGELYKNPDLADTIEFLAKNGVDEFYKGEIGKKIVKDSEEKGGYLRKEDLEDYDVKLRTPVFVDYRGLKFVTNPPPSAGGTLVAFALKVLENVDLSKVVFGSAQHIGAVASAMESAGNVRSLFEEKIREDDVVKEILSDERLSKFATEVSNRVNKWGSTTHTSIIDADGNIATMTNTNGEGCGYVVPGTGTMMNNMLGEEDLNPKGFHNWDENKRISSMMAPSVLVGSESKMALGSAGSNRIRSAILQTVVNYIDFNKNIDEAVNGPRIHFEKGKLDIENGFDKKETEKIKDVFENINIWKDKNLFFGGVNCVVFDMKDKSFSGAGDERREGAFMLAD